jgi:hypothetical protein
MPLFKHREQRAPAPLPLETRLLEWQAEDDHLAELINMGRNFRGFGPSEIEGGAPVALKAGERVFLIIGNASLVEPRSSGGHWEGRTQGVSVRVPGTRSTRYRVGANKGHFVREAEKPTAIDSGTAVVTGQRVVFAGTKQAREWLWTKTIGLEHQDAGWTAIPVSNRQKVSGIAYGAQEAPQVRLRLDLALAVATDTIDQFVADIEADRAQHAGHRPGTPLPPPRAI